MNEYITLTMVYYQFQKYHILSACLKAIISIIIEERDWKTFALNSCITIMSDLRKEAVKNPFLLFS